MVESSPSRRRRPPCKSNKEMSDEAADAADLTYLLTYFTSPCHAAGRCSSWSGLQIHVAGLAQPGPRRLLGTRMVCIKNSKDQRPPVM